MGGIMYRRGSAAPLLVLAIAVSMVLVGFLVLSVSRAAFTDVTNNSANVVGAGTVDLVDDDTGSVLFNISTLIPDQTEVNCIVVTYQGTVSNPGAVKLYSGGFTDSGNFATYLNLTIEEGTGGSFGNCTGFVSQNTIESGGTLANFGTTHTNYANGAGVWDPAATPQSKTYRITFQLDPATPDAQQGESVTALVFTWEVQSG